MAEGHRRRDRGKVGGSFAERAAGRGQDEPVNGLQVLADYAKLTRVNAGSPLDTLPVSDLYDGRMVYLTSDGKLYRYKAGTGWNAPKLAPWLEKSLAKGSTEAFGKPPAYMGEGGSIPFMGMLGDQMPDAQYLLVGVLGPESNAHGPNEFLHVPTVKRVTSTVVDVLAAHAERYR